MTRHIAYDAYEQLADGFAAKVDTKLSAVVAGDADGVSGVPLHSGDAIGTR